MTRSCLYSLAIAYAHSQLHRLAHGRIDSLTVAYIRLTHACIRFFRVEFKSNGGGRMRFNQVLGSGSSTLVGVDTEGSHAFTMHLQPPDSQQGAQPQVQTPPIARGAALGMASAADKTQATNAH